MKIGMKVKYDNEGIKHVAAILKQEIELMVAYDDGVLDHTTWNNILSKNVFQSLMLEIHRAEKE